MSVYGPISYNMLQVVLFVRWCPLPISHIGFVSIFSVGNIVVKEGDGLQV